jgi:hypothetical protein
MMNGQTEEQDREDVSGAEQESAYRKPDEMDLPSGGALAAGPAWFHRKKVMMVICFAFAGMVIAGLVFNRGKSKREASVEQSGYAAKAPREFLKGELDRSLQNKALPGTAEAGEGEAPAEQGEDGLPRVVPVSYTGGGRAAELASGGGEPGTERGGAPASPPYGAPPPQGGARAGGGGGGGSGGGSREAAFTAPFSSMVPSIEGSLFPSNAPGNAKSGGYAEQFPYLTGNPAEAAQAYPRYASAQLPPDYRQNADAFTAQNNQSDKKSFYDQEGAGGNISGSFLADNLLWIGTIIPAVLETAVNTDLPGSVIARVSENVYDSRTGSKLLLPQGTILSAKYNSSVSYAQRRVQIVWDTLIRPDGYQVELGGMNGVDAKGMSGAQAEYHENWFEYLKADGIITMFSVANSKMAEEAAKYGSAEMAAGVTASNAEFINQTGGNIVSRAMNIQPTLTLHNGEKILVMINKNVYLPPVENYPVRQKYRVP